MNWLMALLKILPLAERLLAILERSATLWKTRRQAKIDQERVDRVVQRAKEGETKDLQDEIGKHL